MGDEGKVRRLGGLGERWRRDKRTEERGKKGGREVKRSLGGWERDTG